MDRSEKEPEAKLAVAISAAERKLIKDVPRLNEDVLAAFQQASKGAVQLKVKQMDDLADALSAQANRTEGSMIQRRLDSLVRNIDRLTGNHLRGVREAKASGVQPAGSLSGQLAKKHRGGPKSVRVKPKLAVTLSPAQRETLKSVCTRKSLQQRLRGDGRQIIEFTHREIEYLHNRGRMQVASASSRQKKRLLSVCNTIGKVLGKPQPVRIPID
jgi:hypothetical protein